MKEVTNVLTAQITSIKKYADDVVDLAIEQNNDKEILRMLERALKKQLKVDDVKIVMVQDFVMPCKSDLAKQEI